MNHELLWFVISFIQIQCTLLLCNTHTSPYTISFHSILIEILFEQFWAFFLSYHFIPLILTILFILNIPFHSIHSHYSISFYKYSHNSSTFHKYYHHYIHFILTISFHPFLSLHFIPSNYSKLIITFILGWFHSISNHFENVCSFDHCTTKLLSLRMLLAFVKIKS